MNVLAFVSDMSPAQVAVCIGAGELDQLFPLGWEHVIDLERLNLASSCACIVGQLAQRLDPTLPYKGHDNWSQALQAVFGFKGLDLYHDEGGGDTENAWTAVHGFNAGKVITGDGPLDNDWLSFTELQEAWEELLAVRRAR